MAGGMNRCVGITLGNMYFRPHHWGKSFFYFAEKENVVCFECLAGELVPIVTVVIFTVMKERLYRGDEQLFH